GFGFAECRAPPIARCLAVLERKPNREAGTLARRKIEIADTVFRSAETIAQSRAQAESAVRAPPRRDWATLRLRPKLSAPDESRKRRGASLASTRAVCTGLPS